MATAQSGRMATLAWTIAFLIAAVIAMIIAALPARFAGPTIYPLLWGALASLLLYPLAQWFASRHRLSLPDAGLACQRGWPGRLAAGLAVGVMTYAATLAANALLFGPISFAVVSDIDIGGVAIAVAAASATVTMEEIAFRSFALWSAIDAIGPAAAQGLVAIAFAALHIAYGWPLAVVLLGVLPSALLFGAAAFRSRGLAMPIGVHLGIVACRVMFGESGAPIMFSIDTSRMDAASATAGAPWASAAVTLIGAAILWFYPRAGSGR